MKIIKTLTDKEVKEKIPAGLLDALDNPKDTFYCDNCDGLRNKEHQCLCSICGKEKNCFKDEDGCYKI